MRAHEWGRAISRPPLSMVSSPSRSSSRLLQGTASPEAMRRAEDLTTLPDFARGGCTEESCPPPAQASFLGHEEAATLENRLLGRASRGRAVRQAGPVTQRGAVGGSNRAHPPTGTPPSGSDRREERIDLRFPDDGRGEA